MAKAQYRDGRLARDRAFDHGAAVRKFGKGSGKIFYCPSCGAPVSDSGPGRLGHAQRQARCREAMGL